MTHEIYSRMKTTSSSRCCSIHLAFPISHCMGKHNAVLVRRSPFLFTFKFLSSILCALSVFLNQRKKKNTNKATRVCRSVFCRTTTTVYLLSRHRGIVNPSLFRRVHAERRGKISYANTPEIGKNSQRDN